MWILGIIGALALLAQAVPTQAYEIEKVFYQKAPWTVFRAASAQGSVCEARADQKTGVFRLLFLKGRRDFLVDAISSGWAFKAHTADVRMSFGGSDLVITGATVEGDHVSGVLDMQFLQFFDTFVPDATKTVVVAIVSGQKLGSFKVTGMSTAMRSLNDCLGR